MPSICGFLARRSLLDLAANASASVGRVLNRKAVRSPPSTLLGLRQKATRITVDGESRTTGLHLVADGF